jgi:uncharacterized protein (DUF58 family)
MMLSRIVLSRFRWRPNSQQFPERRSAAVVTGYPAGPAGISINGMLTSRGWWFLLFVLTLLAAGGVLALMPMPRDGLLLLGLVLALWFGWEWGNFAVQARLAVRNLELIRELRDDRGPVTTLWAGQAFAVRGRIRLGGSLPITHALVTDRPPAGAGPVEGELHFAGTLAAGAEVGWEYRVHCPSPGSLRFEGARVRLADPQGFFFFETFLRRPAVVAVLPKLVDAEARQRATKRFNLLPPPGIHRLRRPGSGSELLDLRDYRPGDPPKRIAWKASARRDKLITRELESEVPIRCTLFVDASDAVRLGPPGENALAGLTTIAATVAQAAAGNRDLVGLAVCDRLAADYVAPARSASHTIGLLRRLARTANLAPATEAAEVGPLVDRAYAFAADVYPDLLRPAVNRFPAWLPFFSPQPGWTMRRPPSREVWLRVVRTLGLAMTAAGVMVGLFLEDPAAAPIALATVLLGALVAVLGYVVWIPWAFFTRDRRRYAWRKKLASTLAVLYRHPPGALALFLEEDAACARELQRFLADHQVPYDVPLYDARGRYLFARPEKVGVLAKALLRAVGRGHDNELYVIMADLLELDEHLGPLLKAVRVARARHHTVMVVCPWPPGLPMPDAGADTGLPPPDISAADLVRRMAHARATRAWRTVRRAFGRMGVPVLNAAAGDPARLILLRMEQLRAVQGASRG